MHFSRKFRSVGRTSDLFLDLSKRQRSQQGTQGQNHPHQYHYHHQQHHYHSGVCFMGAAASLLIQTLWWCSVYCCLSSINDHGLFPATHAWIIAVRPLRRKDQHTHSTSSSTQQLFNAFLWFGGGDDNSDNKDDSKSNKVDWPYSSLWSNNNSNGTNTPATTNNDNINDNTYLRSISQVMDTKLGSFKASQKVGDKMTSILTELANTVVEGYSSSESSNNKYKNKVKVTFNGQQVPIRVQIDDQYFQELLLMSSSSSSSPSKSITKDSNYAVIVEELNLAITTAMKEAHIKSSQKLQDKLKGLYQDLSFF
jgi:DNA-binding protein YbaB